MSSIAIGPATPADLQAILDLLERCELPTVGLADHLADTLVARMADRVVGSVALEVYADGALLRSVAVDQSVRGTGIGVRLTEAALKRARNRGIAAVYLLTTTAQHFFPRFGFEEIARDDVPLTIHASAEFESACPATATVMRKRL
jgi:amino-acid N-acetyltransferase